MYIRPEIAGNSIIWYIITVLARYSYIPFTQFPSSYSDLYAV